MKTMSDNKNNNQLDQHSDVLISNIIEVSSKLVYESILGRIAGRTRPERMALTDFVDELMYMTHTSVEVASASNEHIKNIQIVFGSYISSTGIDDKDKSEKMRTQLWLIDNLLYFVKNYDNIAQANDVLCELGEYIEEHKNI